jgi:DNA-binding transcriptional ArsR family regulator
MMSDIQAILRALNDKTRRDILNLLKKEGVLSAGEISSYFDMTNATISHHLLILKEANLVSDEKVGKYIYYSINTSVIQDLLIYISGLLDNDQGGGK